MNNGMNNNANLVGRAGVGLGILTMRGCASVNGTRAQQGGVLTPLHEGYVGRVNGTRAQKGGVPGFTLIEVMIVIAIIGVLAAISIPAYQDYIENTNMAKVTSHFEGGVRFAGVELRKVQTDIAVGRLANLTAADGTGNYTQAGFVALLNASGGTAPGGGAPYVGGGGNTTTGAIGVTVTGTLAASNWEATFERPKIYGFASATTRKASWSEI